MGETGPTAEIANKVSKEIFKWFRWDRVRLHDQNYKCLKQKKHAPTKTREHTHPVDVVFKYLDPYLNKIVLLNTDLKSYKKDSITGPNVRGALKSMAQSIDCARVSTEWREQYDESGTADIRGLLFVYNHDAEYDSNFARYLTPPKPKDKRSNEDAETGLTAESLPLEAGQLLHIVEPRTIAYMTTVIADAHRMHAEGNFPSSNYYFYYPELKLHRTHGVKHQRPATIEMICAPFLIVEHEEIKKLNEESGQTEVTFPPGVVIFYNRAGSSHYEFLYLFDLLSSYQMLDADIFLRIRVVHHAPNSHLRSHFNKAIHDYVHDWGFDEYKKERLENIQLEIVEIQKTSFSQKELGWEGSKN